MSLSLLRSGVRAHSAVIATLLGGLLGGSAPTTPTTTPLSTPSTSLPTTPSTTLPPITVPSTTVPLTSLPATTPLVGSLSAADAGQQVIVRFDPDLPTAQRDQVIQAAGLKIGAHLELPDTIMAWVTLARDTTLKTLATIPGVEWAEPNTVVSASLDQSYAQTDPLWPKLWGLENFGDDGGAPDADIDIAEAWSVTKGSASTVAVVDTGVDDTHPDLVGQLVAGANFTGDGQVGTADGSGHGTHVTGTIAAAENTIGVIGAAPAAKVMPLRVLGKDGSGSSAAVTSAFAYAGQHGIRVVNASLGSASPSRAQRDAIAASPNTLFVVAAGNTGINVDGGTASDYPCAYDLANVLCVGASNRQDDRASFSNFGPTSVDLFAPGQDILSTYPGNSYQYSSGTSMAAPHAAAVAALLVAAHPDWTATHIKTQLEVTVDQPAGLAGTSVTNGRLNAARATGLYAGPDGLAPSQVTGLRATPGNGRVDLTWQPASSLDLALYQVEMIKGGAWTEQQVTSAESASVTGLPAGVPVTFRVRAIDQSGEEGDASASVTATPIIATSASGSVSGKIEKSSSASRSASGSAAAGKSCTATGASGFGSLRRTLAKGRVRGISFRLASACRISIIAKRSVSATGARAPMRTTLALQFPAGVSTVKFGTGTSDLRLRPGTWKLTVVATDVRSSIKVKVR